MNGFPDISRLLAHRGDMLLLERVLDAEADRIRVLARVDAVAWYADPRGDMPAWVGIELMAQAVAAWAGLAAWRDGAPPKQGFLLGTRVYVCHVPVFPAGAELVVGAVEVFKENNGLAAFDCVITSGGETLAAATLKVFEPEDFAAFMEQES